MLTLLCSFVVAQDDDDDLGTDKLAQTGMKFLSFSPDARAAALGMLLLLKQVEHHLYFIILLVWQD